MKYFLSLLSLVLLSACSNENLLKEANYNGYAQGTTFHISYLYQGEDISNMQSKLDAKFREIDMALSTYVDNSEISRLNRGEEVTISRIFKTVHEKSIEVWKESGAYFDPTVGKLVRFWGFGPDARRAVDTADVDSIKNYIGLDKLSSIRMKWSIPKGMELDYNAIAQGYSVDLICEMLMKEGIKNYMVEVGGEVRCLGQNLEGKAWRIGVDKPTEEIDAQDRFQFILGMDSMALATSGNYRKFWVDTATGMRYAHTINTKTGYPAKNQLLSASVLAPTCMEADAYATAFMSMGLKKTLLFLRNPPLPLEVYLIYSEEGKDEWQVWQSEGFEKLVLN